jgi:DNA-binding beta-propeller fold protein YncE
VGYGDGALGAIDLEGRKVGKIKLDAHPESFQIEDSSHRIFVNLPESKRISVVDQMRGTVVASWGTGRAAGNFPMAFDQADQRLFVVCRSPAKMIVLNTISGSVVANMPAVGDSDDVFYDQARKRIYATGGAGDIWVYQQEDPDHYRELARMSTVEGARTGFFSPELNLLFVATRQHDQRPAEIRIYEPK